MTGMQAFIRMFMSALVERCNSREDLVKALALLDADLALVRAESANLGLIPVNGKPVAGVN